MRNQVLLPLICGLVIGRAALAELPDPTPLGEGVERHLSSDEPVNQWVHDPEVYRTEAGDRFEVREVAGGWQIATKTELHEEVRRFLKTRPSAKLSIASLETLAVIAYKPPVTVPEEPLGAARGWLCVATLVVAVLCFLPAPFVALL